MNASGNVSSVNMNASGNVSAVDVNASGDLTVSSLTVDGGILRTNSSGLVSSSVTLPNGTLASTQQNTDNSTKVATTAYVKGVVGDLINSAPEALDTLKEIADYLGTDETLSGSIVQNLALKAPLESPTFTNGVNVSSGDLTISSGFLKISIFEPNSNGILFSNNNGIILSSTFLPLETTAQTVAQDINSDIIATTSYVRTGLSSKANSADVYTQSEINDALTLAEITVNNALVHKAPVDSPTFTNGVTVSSGDLTVSSLTTDGGILRTNSLGVVSSSVTLPNGTLASTQQNTDNSTKVATTAYVTNNLVLKAPLASPTFTGTVNGIDKSMVGLENVDNTSDANKPISTATQTALVLKANLASPTFTGDVRIENSKNWAQLGLDIDGEASGDNSGYSVSLSSDGTIVAIGAPYNDGTSGNDNDDRGHVRVYKWNDLTLNWYQLGQDIDGQTSNDQSGYSISLSGDGTTVAISAPNNDGTNGTDSNNRGHVRVYKWDGLTLTWDKLGEDIDGEASDDQSGFSVSLSSDGTTVAIGAILNNENGSNSGHVRVYKWNDLNLTWYQLGQDINGEASNDQSGYSVSLSSDGTTVAIGARYNGTNSSGHVRVYKWNDLTFWNQLGEDIDGEASNDQSGISVSLSSDGTIVAIGARLNDGTSGNPSDSRGHVRVYKWNDLTFWNQLGQDIDGEASGNQSGYSVSLSSDGTIVAIGAPLNGFTGHVRVYKLNDLTWNKLGQDIDGEASNDLSGLSVSLSSDGTTVAIGAIYNDGTNGTNNGHVRVYKLPTFKSLNIYGTDIQINDGDLTVSSLTTDGGILRTNSLGVVSSSVTLPNGTLASTQQNTDNSTKVATTAYVTNNLVLKADVSYVNDTIKEKINEIITWLNTNQSAGLELIT